MNKDILILSTLYWRPVSLTIAEFQHLANLLKSVGIGHLEKNIEDDMLREKISSCPRWVERGTEEINWLLGNGAKVTYLGHSHYPSQFYTMRCPPLIVTYRGQEVWKKRDSLAIVGSRNPSQETIEWINFEVPAFLKDKDLNIVSGGARGVDQAAHRVSLRSEAPTICFLPSGLRRPYPPNFFSYLSKIVEAGGCIISQFSPFSNIYKSHFFYRNELIVKISNLIFIAEAAQKSGSMLTAKLAIRDHKSIVTLPCSPVAKGGRGNLSLIYDGAQMLRDSDDLSTAWSLAESSPG